VGTSPATTSKRNAQTRRERSAATRARILEAVVCSIDEVGFARTTSQRIAHCAGVSVGAVQHHFASKDAILAAVLERSVRSLEARFEGVAVEGATLAERVGAFVDRAWLHYGSAAFRSTAEILANARDLASGETDAPYAPAILASARGATRLWNRVFAGIDLPAQRQREIRRFAFAALTGLANAKRFEAGDAALRPQVELLKAALLAIFEQAGAGSIRLQ
jgi:AcrR family transcriptional regulator